MKVAEVVRRTGQSNFRPRTELGTFAYLRGLGNKNGKGDQKTKRKALPENQEKIKNAVS